jgi:hypothetical protein
MPENVAPVALKLISRSGDAVGAAAPDCNNEYNCYAISQLSRADTAASLARTALYLPLIAPKAYLE